MASWSPWANPTYCWVVICKNKKFHKSENFMFGHRIPLGETDDFEPLPVSGPFIAQCDDCHAEHIYEPEEVLRISMELPEFFQTHPRFE